MTSAMVPATSSIGNEIFEQILAAPGGLVVLDSDDAHGLIAHFGAIARHTGQAVYLWQPDTGLGSLRDVHVRVADCQRLGNALRYMQQSMHFGIYFLLGLELPLSAMDAALLKQLARAPKEYTRRVVIIGAPVALTGQLAEFATQLSCRGTRQKRLRLRDGRWLV